MLFSCNKLTMAGGGPRCLTALVLLVAAGLAGASLAQEGPHLDTALKGGAISVSDSPNGFIPPSFGTDHYAKAVAEAVAAAADPGKTLPLSYDARQLGRVSPVKNQDNCGACYAFSSAADLESKILGAGLGEFDLSENSMKECHYQGSGCSGGNQFRIINYLATSGATLEACDPYVPADVDCTLGCDSSSWCWTTARSPAARYPDRPSSSSTWWIAARSTRPSYAGDDAVPLWRDQVTGYDGTGALYYTGTPGAQPFDPDRRLGRRDRPRRRHRRLDRQEQLGNGWGGTCGYGAEGGYFYIAYGSASIGMYSSFVKEFMVRDPDAGLLYHDEGGFTSAFGGLGTVIWGMGSFTATANTKLHRVEFWTSDATEDVDVYIYANFVGGDLVTLLASQLNNSFAEPGYHYVELDQPMTLTPAQTFYVAVRFENQSYTYPLTADGDGVPDAGKSWYSFNGWTWTSLEPHAVDTTIRVRTSTNAVLATDDRDEDQVEPDGGPIPRGLAMDSAWPNPFNPTTSITYHLPQDGPVTVAVFDLMGRRVRTLFEGNDRPGSRTVVWDGRSDNGAAVPSGVYFCRVFAADQMRGIKLALLK